MPGKPLVLQLIRVFLTYVGLRLVFGRKGRLKQLSIPEVHYALDLWCLGVNTD